MLQCVYDTVLLLMVTLGNSYMLYYIWPLHTFSFCLVYVVMRVGKDLNHNKLTAAAHPNRYRCRPEAPPRRAPRSQPLEAADGVWFAETFESGTNFRRVSRRRCIITAFALSRQTCRSEKFCLQKKPYIHTYIHK